jgi:hypothetical protein
MNAKSNYAGAESRCCGSLAVIRTTPKLFTSLPLKNISKLIIALLLSSAAFAQVPVGAQLVDGAGHGVNGSFLRFELWNCGANFPVNTANPLIIVQRRFDLKANSAGIVTGQVIPNDQIKCGGVVSTRWMVTPMKDATTPLTETKRFDILFANGAFNPATVQPDISVAPIPGFRLIYSNPSGSQTITQPSGTSLAVVGALDLTKAIVTGITQGGGGGLACNTTTNPGSMYWDGTQCQVDIHLIPDGAGNVIGVSLILSGASSAASYSTSGTGGILDGQFQVAPSSITLGHYQVFGDVNTGLLGCLKNPSGTLVSCLSGLQKTTSGTTTLAATLVTANGGCNIYTTSATGVSSTSQIIPFVNVDVAAVSGYGPGQLEVYPPVASANLVSFKVCNPTAVNITPASLTLSWIAL